MFIRNDKAFSLLEIAVVLSIIGAIIALAAPRLFDRKSETRRVFRDFIVAGKDIKSRAKMTGNTYRLAFDLNEKSQSWWVEKSTRVTVLDKAAIEKAQQAEKSELKDSEAPPPDFQLDPAFFKSKQRMPDGFKFKQIESGTVDFIYTEGMGYIHFFPQGLIETSAIQIEDPKKNVWTLVFNPLTGQTDVIPEAKQLKDLSR